jgi:tetratricopeptide (TPR) repeat protein
VSQAVAKKLRSRIGKLVLVAAAICSAVVPLASSQQSTQARLQGTVRDAIAKPVAGASVSLQLKDGSATVTAVSDARGAFSFSALRAGSYVLSADKAGLHEMVSPVVALSDGEHKQVDIVLESRATPRRDADTTSRSAAQAMQFADKPNFTVAGVTDWTAVGGHGSDSILRTSEDLTRQTLALKGESAKPGAANQLHAGADDSENQLRAALADAPGSFEANRRLGELYLRSGRYNDAIPLLRAAYQIDPSNHMNEFDLALAYKGAGEYSLASEHAKKLLVVEDNADLHRLAGDLDEQAGDSLAAVHEYEQAARLEPSEQNYFEWGSELLLHRAVWQAQEVFHKGVEAHPKSMRLLTGLGTALFAGDLYDQAAERICEASDLNPGEAAPYEFLGKIEIAAPMPLACVEPKLARFAKERPENSQANYLYAMAIWKRQGQPPDRQAVEQVESLLTKAVTVDANCGEAYLQLGILKFSKHDVEKAIEFYKKAIEANPQLGEAYYRLGVAYDRVGDSAKAKEEFQFHDQIEKQQADAVERQRREVKQFLVVLEGQPTNPPSN